MGKPGQEPGATAEGRRKRRGMRGGGGETRSQTPFFYFFCWSAGRERSGLRAASIKETGHRTAGPQAAGAGG
eukprot:9499444-Pyramimonas_sp.AAC.1